MGLIYLIIFFTWPLGGVFFSLKNYSKKWTKNIIWLFVVFYGYAFIIGNDTMDANRIKSKFEVFTNLHFNFNEFLAYYFIENANTVDLLQPFIFYLTAKFTDRFDVLMAILAFIFGFFYSRNISYIIDKGNSKIKYLNILIILLFSFVIGFWQINGFRFWTSSVMFFYAIIPYVFENDRKRLWILIPTVLLHFSFLFPTLIFIIYLTIKEKPKVYFYCFIISFFILSVNTEVVGSLLMQILPSNFHGKISAYTSTAYATEIEAAKASISAYLRTITFVIVNIFFIIIYYWNQKQVKSNHNLYRLFNFCLLIMTAGNLVSIIPSGHRFQYLSVLFSLAFLFLFIQRFKPEGYLKIAIQISAPFLFFSIFGFLRTGLNSINIIVVIGNPIMHFFIESQKTLSDFF